jgi:hypothetical protein
MGAETGLSCCWGQDCLSRQTAGTNGVVVTLSSRDQPVFSSELSRHCSRSESVGGATRLTRVFFLAALPAVSRQPPCRLLASMVACEMLISCLWHLFLGPQVLGCPDGSDGSDGAAGSDGSDGAACAQILLVRRFCFRFLQKGVRLL